MLKDRLHLVVILFAFVCTHQILQLRGQLIEDPRGLGAEIPFDLISARIVGGHEALDEQFPYQVGLMLFTDNRFAWCGGSLIARRWVLTAAHCLRATQGATVYLGTHRILGANEVGTQVLITSSDDFVVHPNYNEAFVTNDIGLIRLPVDAKISRDIKTIALPDYSEADESFEGVMAVTSGWGLESDSAKNISNVLRYVNLEIISNILCIYFYGVIPIRSSNLCTSGYSMKGPCNGDSGGPLVYEKNKKKVLIGLTSFGSRQCESKMPSVFTRVSYYLKWIKDITGL